MADILSGAYAFGAIQAALVHRERTGQGQAVDVSLMNSMLNLMVFECQEAQFPSEQTAPGLRADEDARTATSLSPRSARRTLSRWRTR